MVPIPIIIDTGLGSASDATFATEMGMDAVFPDTAIAEAKDPLQMAQAMKLAVQSGRAAFLAGRVQRTLHTPAEENTGDTMAPAIKGA